MSTVWCGPDWEAFVDGAGAELRAGVVAEPDVFTEVLVGAEVRAGELVEAEARWVPVGAEVRAGVFVAPEVRAGPVEVEAAGADAFTGALFCPPTLDMAARETWLGLV